ncbi:MAG: hypothetical protein WBB67_07220 [bacterium]
MPITNYDGETFVAYMDIAGFKELMREEKEALKVLDKFYQSGYSLLRNQDTTYRIEGIFVSDCGVLFARRDNNPTPCASGNLLTLLEKIKQINIKMRDSGYMVTTSIAYGKFRYQQRIEFEGIDKNQIYGNAYVTAFLDNEKGKPRIQPGQCRIIKQNLPANISNFIMHNENNDFFKMIRKRRGDGEHYYYYWMVDNPVEIEKFEQNYGNSYILKYAGMLKALKGGTN